MHSVWGAFIVAAGLSWFAPGIASRYEPGDRVVVIADTSLTVANQPVAPVRQGLVLTIDGKLRRGDPTESKTGDRL